MYGEQKKRSVSHEEKYVQDQTNDFVREREFVYVVLKQQYRVSGCGSLDLVKNLIWIIEKDLQSRVV